MFSIPDPLHPAIVHFPIVLLLLGGLVAVATVFLNRWHLAWVAAGLLLLGAIGAFIAVETGESAQEIVGELPEFVEQLLDEHEEWAERTETVAGIAAILSVIGATFGTLVAHRKSQLSAPATAASPEHKMAGMVSLSSLAFGMRMLTAIVALLACVFIYQTGHRGGRLVYKYGVGVKHHTAAAASSSENPYVEYHEDDN